MHTSEFFEQTTIQDPWSEVPAEDWNNWKWQAAYCRENAGLGAGSGFAFVRHPGWVV